MSSDAVSPAPINKKFVNFAWATLVVTILVIISGGYVRASKSGDGCGAHWPKCNGEFIPPNPTSKTLVEYGHRLSTSVVYIMAIALLIWAFRAYPKKHPVRLGAVWSFILMTVEAGLGAGLVLYEMVAGNTSVARAFWMGGHLANTFLLLGAIVLTAWWAMRDQRLQLKDQGSVKWALFFGLACMLLLSITGAIAALGDTLFPETMQGGITEALEHSFASTSHMLIRLRVFHPLIALSVGLYLVLIAALCTHLRPSPDVQRFARGLAGLFLFQIGLGLLNVYLKAPIWLQMVHLLVADLNWLCLTLLTASALAVGVPHKEKEKAAALPADAEPVAAPTLGTYISLTKPRVISLLLFTAMTAMFIAKRGWPGIVPFLGVMFGFYMAAGSANAINMVIDRDIDGKMTRTSKRATVTQQISSRNALIFAFCLELASFTILSLTANMLSAMLALAGLVYYVVIYTMLLKRRTWNNIVIGGAAGAFPPLVGWAAVTNDLTPLAWLLFGLIFLWTPVHFWALAILLKDDYAEAGVPMLPNVHGERATTIQIGFYMVLTVAISLVPIWFSLGWFYLIATVPLNAILAWFTWKLYLKPERPQARKLFHYSMLYLALLFLAMAIDQAALTIPVRL